MAAEPSKEPVRVAPNGRTFQYVEHYAARPVKKQPKMGAFERKVTELADPLVKKLDSTKVGKAIVDQLEKAGAVFLTMLTNRNVHEDLASAVALGLISSNPITGAALGILVSPLVGNAVREITRPDDRDINVSGITMLARALKTGRIQKSAPRPTIKERIESGVERFGVVVLTLFQHDKLRADTDFVMLSGIIGGLATGLNPLGIVGGLAVGLVARQGYREAQEMAHIGSGMTGAKDLEEAWRTGKIVKYTGKK